MRQTITIGLLLITLCLTGCGETYRKTTMTVMEQAQRTEDEVVRQFATIAKSKAVALAKTRLEGGDDITQVLQRLMQDMEDIAYLEMQHAIAKNLNGHAWIYVSSREPWVSKALDDMKGALSDSDSFDHLPPSTRQALEVEAEKAKEELKKHQENLEKQGLVPSYDYDGDGKNDEIN